LSSLQEPFFSSLLVNLNHREANTKVVQNVKV
jgi:hypothetical protein